MKKLLHYVYHKLSKVNNNEVFITIHIEFLVNGDISCSDGYHFQCKILIEDDMLIYIHIICK